MRFRLLAALLIMPALASAALPPGIPDGWSDGYVYANGIRLHYYRATPAPGKPVIVMFHGVTDIGLSWTTLTWKLQKDYDIYMVDARGHGLSDPLTASDDRQTMVKDAMALLQAMKLEKPILMGHSMGAGTLMRLGADYPDAASAIILLDPRLGATGAPPPRSPAEASSKPAAPPARDQLPVSMFGPPEVLVAQNNYPFDDLVATCSRQMSMWDLVDCQYWALSKKQYHGDYSGAWMNSRPGTPADDDPLAKITVPTLILKADAPPEERKKHQEAASVLRQGKLVHIDGSGHNLHHDKLDATVTALTEFLSKH